MNVYRVEYSTIDSKFCYLWIITDNFEFAAEKARLTLNKQNLAWYEITSIQIMGKAHIDYREEKNL